MFKKISKKKLIGFICSVLALSMVVGVWAYYSATNALDNQLLTKTYGNELSEKFTPKMDWQPGETVEKQVLVTNTGDYDLFVRVGMSESWSLASTEGIIEHIIASSGSYFLSATKEFAIQGSTTDGIYTNDQSVVYKELLRVGTGVTDWTFNQSDGCWYYNSKLKPGESTSVLLNSITLAGNTDMGKYDQITYYTKAPSKPLSDNIGNDDTSQWVVYSSDMPTGTTFTRAANVLNLKCQGYAHGTYALTIASQTLQATQEAFTAAAWYGTPPSVKAAWGVF